MGRRPVHIVDPLQPQQLAASEQVRFLDAERGTVLAAAAGERHVRCQRPDVLRGYLYVDDAIFVADGLDAGVVDEPVRAHDALGFLEQAAGVDITLLEKDLVANYAVAGDDVQPVRPAVQPLVFLGIRKIEDIALLEHDVADNRARRLEVFVFRYGLGNDHLGSL